MTEYPCGADAEKPESELSRLTSAVCELIARASKHREQLSTISNRVFGGVPENCGEVAGLAPNPGTMGELKASLEALSGQLDQLSHEINRLEGL